MLHNILTDPRKKKLAAALAFTVIAAAGWYGYNNSGTDTVPEKNIPLVRILTVGTSSSASDSSYPGEVRGRYESNLAFQVTGKINARYVNIGDPVRAGQVLMTIDPKDVLQAVENSNAQLASASANQKLAADNAARYATLYSSGAVSKAVLDQYDTQLEAANAALRQAQAQAQANTSSNQLEYTNLRSDADGVVANITGEIGQISAAGSPLVTVIRNGEREIQIVVPENKLFTVSLGAKAMVTFWALENTQAEGRVREISPVADPVTRTYKVRVAVADLPPEAKLGMTAKVILAGDTAETIKLPIGAIYQVTNQPQVWIVDNNNKARLINVTLGEYRGNEVTVTSGLKKGDRIITAGINKLTENQEVRILESGEQP